MLFYSLFTLGVITSIGSVIALAIAVYRAIFGREELDDDIMMLPFMLTIVSLVLFFACAIPIGIGSVEISSWLDKLVIPFVAVDFCILALYAILTVVIIIVAPIVWIIVSIRRRALIRRILYGLSIVVIVSVAFVGASFLAILLTIKLSSMVSHAKINAGDLAKTLSHYITTGLHLEPAPGVFITIALTGAIALLFLVAVALRFRIPWNGGESSRASSTLSIATNSFRHAVDIAARTLKRLTGGRNDRPVFHGSQRRAEEAIDGRREFIRGQLREYRRSRPRLEVLEIPPPLRGAIELRGLSEQAADATIVQLLYERNDQALLFGRVVNSLVCFARMRGLSIVAGTEILLRPLHWWERLQGEYRWVALIRTPHSDEIGQFVTSIRDWLGIGVRVTRPAGWASQRQCLHSGDIGTVAGQLKTRDPNIDYYLTCAHVVPESCVYSKLNRKTASKMDEPDAALLSDHGCVQGSATFARVKFATQRFLEHLGAQKKSVYRVGGYSPKVSGYLKSELATYWTEDGNHERFPSCVIQTKRTRYFWGRLPIPLIKSRFSTPGDSGSWVLARREDYARPIWIGMVAAGGEGDGKMESYVVKASELLWYLRLRLRREAPFIPYAEDL